MQDFDSYDVIVVGAGMAGSEAAHQLSRFGLKVLLYEQKPKEISPAHRLPGFAEMVCSNSFRSASMMRAVGILKNELSLLDSLLMSVAQRTKVPAGDALAVDREKFSEMITELLSARDNIEIRYEKLCEIPDTNKPVIIATGPLTAKELFADLSNLIGENFCDFYDAVAPIVDFHSVDMDNAFMGSRNRPDDKDYLNCPMNKEEYLAFIEAVRDSVKVDKRDFEEASYFEACLPMEVMAERGVDTLRYGPLKPVGLIDPKTGEEPYACLQLRTENVDMTAFNLVGCQTRLKFPEQKRIFGMIPALKKANFLRYGFIHRNSYLKAPVVLSDDLSLKKMSNVYIAGQLSGVEGYLESCASGLLVSYFVLAKHFGLDFSVPPRTTSLGALYYHLRPDFKVFKEDFSPQNVNYSLFEPLGRRYRRKERREKFSKRAQEEFSNWAEAACQQFHKTSNVKMLESARP